MDVDIPVDVAFHRDNQGAENLRLLVEDKLNIRNSNSDLGRDPVPIVLGMLHHRILSRPLSNVSGSNREDSVWLFRMGRGSVWNIQLLGWV